MNNPINDKPSHPLFDGKSRDEVYEIMEYSSPGISKQEYSIGEKILYWKHEPMIVDGNVRTIPQSIGHFRIKIGDPIEEWYHFPETGFRVVRNKR